VPDLMELRKKNLPDAWTKAKREQEMRIPAWLLQLIAKCLEKDPENRYANGMVLQDALVAGSLAAEVTPVAANYPETSIVEEQGDDPELALAHTYDYDDRMRISKPLFFALMGMFFLSLGTVGYLLFDQNRFNVPIAKTAKDSLPKVDSDSLKKSKQGAGLLF